MSVIGGMARTTKASQCVEEYKRRGKREKKRERKKERGKCPEVLYNQKKSFYVSNPDIGVARLHISNPRKDENACQKKRQCEG
jgi:hypothetical protein